MSIESVLKKEGMEEIIPLDTLTVNRIAMNISKKLSTAFSEHNLHESDLFAAICRLEMYFAKMPDDLCGAKYFYKNNAIYFNKKYKLEEIEESAVHECIHYLQEVKDEKGNLMRMGLYDFKDGKLGLAINEAAVQLMASEACGKEEDKVKYYDLFLSTKSPDFYPLECVLLNEMTYFTGNYPLYHSTLHGDNVFKNTFANKYGARTYSTIEKRMDNILKMESDLNEEIIKIQYTNSDRKVKQINKTIEDYKEKIAELFLSTQDYIMEKCFNKDYEEIQTIEDLNYFKDKIYGFKDILGYSVDYKNYNNFYIQKMNDYELKKQQIENGDLEEIKERNISKELISINNKQYSFIKRLLIKLGILTDINREAQWLKQKDK